MSHATHTAREVAYSTSRFLRPPARAARRHSFAFVSPPVPDRPREDASADLDAIARLGDEIAIQSAHIHAATHHLLEMIAEFDRKRGWEADGQRSCAHWLALRTGIDLGSAREKVRAARALEQLPLISAAMSRGQLSVSQVRALTRVARPDNEGALLELARGATTAQLERMVRAIRKGSRSDEAEADRERRASRTLSIFPGDDGMYEIRGRLTPEVGALLMRAIEAAGDALFLERDAITTTDTARDAAQRRADAIGLLADRALSAGFGPTDPDVPVSGTRAQRYQVVLHVDTATLSADGEPGRAELEDGTRVSHETCRRVACDASVVRVTHDSLGSVLDAGRRTRTISPALRRALDVRDRGCRFPGCGLRFTDAHHVQHWAAGGETSLANCLLLCSHHHTLVHEGGWRVQWWGKARPVFIDPRGHEHFDGRWQPPQLGPCPVDTLLEQHRRRGVEPDAWTAGARWKCERDIPEGIYFRASEAL
jgi:hypothetical protein